jgi:hypothetical protein
MEGVSAAMAVRLRLSDRELVEDLLDFLDRRECAGERVVGTEDEIDVSLPHTLHARQAEMELDLLVGVWEALHPGTSVDRVARPAGV